MKNVLIIDTETSGLDPQKDVAIEVAAVVYNLPNRCVLESFATLIEHDSNGAESTNHIPATALHNARRSSYAWGSVDKLAAGYVADAVLAHNGDFDRQFVPTTVGVERALLAIPWVDTMTLDWPKQSKPGNSLISLAIEHGLGVVDPHRALSDCMLIARLLTRCAELGHDLEKLLAPGLRPRATFQAMVSFDEKDKAKESGFHWDATTRRWLRKMAVEDASKLGFCVREVEV